jgi:hypothetical protein
MIFMRRSREGENPDRGGVNIAPIPTRRQKGIVTVIITRLSYNRPGAV